MMQRFQLFSGLLGTFLMITNVQAQTTFETMLAKESIVVGEPFRVQYIIRNASSVERFKTPPFKHFNLVSGPDIYKGTEVKDKGVVQTTNIIVTLSATQPGKFVLEGASATIDGAVKKSKDVFIEVLSLKQAESLGRQQAAARQQPGLYLEAGEDVMDKLRQNIFLRVSVNKKTCYVGEPVVAEFKLYSRLESRSEIVKNPGFYGFGVHDVVSTTDKVNAIEIINGEPFDVHIIRKVQLYPLRPGKFTIDAMELDNKIYLARHDEVDAMMPQQDAAAPEIYDLDLRTPAVDILVKPLPAGAPESFNGAVGSFDLNARLQQSTLKQNDEGRLQITVRGKGNLSQVGMPDLEWPPELEAFEPVASENFDKQLVPLTGTKIFEVPFVGNKAGNYIIAPVVFSYFNLKTGRYETISSESIAVNILGTGNNTASVAESPKPGGGTGGKGWLWIPVGLLCAAAIFYWVKRKSSGKIAAETRSQETIPITQIMSGPALLMNQPGAKFYEKLKDAVWIYFNDRLGISGSEQNKNVLEQRLHEKGVEAKLVSDVIRLLEQCEWSIYTSEVNAREESFYFAQAESIMYKCDRYLLA